MKKKLALIASVLLLLGVIVAAVLWYLMGQPLYEPGMIRTGKLQLALEPPAQTDEPNFWVVEEGIKLHHYSDGTGSKVLVVHGGPGHPIQTPWHGLKPLTSDHEFVYYDQRGCGNSTRPFTRFTSPNYLENMKALERTLGLGAQVADIERIRRILGEEKLSLIGHSFGAFLASLYAAEFPERIGGMILVAPAEMLVMPIEGDGLFEAVGERLPEGVKDEYTQFVDDYLDFGSVFSRSEEDLIALNRRFAEYYATAARATDLYVPDMEGERESGGWMVWAMYFSMGRRHDYRDALKRVQAPVLVIHGAQDLQTENASRAYAEFLPNSQFEVIADAGHFLYDEQPEQFAALASRFLAKAE